MTAKAQRPEGTAPRANKQCPLCKAPPGVAHKPFCPWRKWAEAWAEAGKP